MAEAKSADWRDHLTPAERAEIQRIEALLAAVKPLRARRREIEIRARCRSRSKRLNRKRSSAGRAAEL